MFRLTCGVETETTARAQYTGPVALGGFEVVDVDGCGTVVCADGCHKGFEAVASACYDAVIELNLRPDNSVHALEGWVGRMDFEVEEMQTEDGEGNDPIRFD